MLYTITETNDIPPGHAATATAWMIKIRPAYKDDIGLIEHEKSHVRDFWRSGMLYIFLIRFSKKYLLECEVRAYKKQLEYPPATEDVDHYRRHYAEFISTKYGLNISVEDAYRLLG